jgi:hypothetical protein
MRVAHANYRPDAVAVPSPVQPWPATAQTGTHQPFDDCTSTSPTSPVTPDLLRALLRSLRRLR